MATLTRPTTSAAAAATTTTAPPLPPRRMSGPSVLEGGDIAAAPTLTTTASAPPSVTISTSQVGGGQTNSCGNSNNSNNTRRASRQETQYYVGAPVGTSAISLDPQGSYAPPDYRAVVTDMYGLPVAHAITAPPRSHQQQQRVSPPSSQPTAPPPQQQQQLWQPVLESPPPPPASYYPILSPLRAARTEQQQQEGDWQHLATLSTPEAIAAASSSLFNQQQQEQQQQQQQRTRESSPPPPFTQQASSSVAAAAASQQRPQQQQQFVSLPGGLNLPSSSSAAVATVNNDASTNSPMAAASNTSSPPVSRGSFIRRWGVTLFGGEEDMTTSQPGSIIAGGTSSTAAALAAGSGRGARGSSPIRDGTTQARGRVLEKWRVVQEGTRFTGIVQSRRKEKPGDETLGYYDTEREAALACVAYSPPILEVAGGGGGGGRGNNTCSVCSGSFGLITKRKHHCRNCGTFVCGGCSDRKWPVAMVPFTFAKEVAQKSVRVCDSCHTDMEAFRTSLLRGQSELALHIFNRGRVNLRCPYIIYDAELPVHCAAAGGSLELLSWLVEDRCCPVYVDPEHRTPLGNRKRQSVLAVAAHHGHVAVMRYLLLTQQARVAEVTELPSLWTILDKLLREGMTGAGSGGGGGSSAKKSSSNPFGDSKKGSYGGGGSSSAIECELLAPSAPMEAVFTSQAAGEMVDECIVCFDRPVDCTLVPCGHHCCCVQCASTFLVCPVCRATVQQAVKAIKI